MRLKPNLGTLKLEVLQLESQDFSSADPAQEWAFVLMQHSVLSLGILCALPSISGTWAAHGSTPVLMEQPGIPCCLPDPGHS